MIRTYYWHERVVGRAGHWILRRLARNADRYFSTGNAGDIFVKDLIGRQFGMQSANVSGEGRRLLLIGSIAHKALPGDVICGIGSKTPELPVKDKDLLVHALRGPMSYEAFGRAGHDLTQVKFLLDPGLLIREFVDTAQSPKIGRIGLVAHYRERSFYAPSPEGIHLINIDASPIAVARGILSCEMIYSSSLHGIVFAHALGRPCVLLRPRTPEPLFKYRDYYASVGLPMPVPLDELGGQRFASKPVSPADIRFTMSDFSFPSPALLRERGVIVGDA
ncbi:polysaccharide pyruvyl transferase family protein [Pelagibacterium nitratireducens]|uniref:Polysaccharide pyruvyl transferase family protein n=1 Tax=Pelagibacterium nitratireducens TaxID=1046114 RepID=A0ABZ2I7U9_9HYPH